MTVSRAGHRATVFALAALVLLPAPVVAAMPASGGQSAISAHVSDGDPGRQAALRLLAQPPFPPTDLGLLSTRSYPQGPPMQPAPPREITVRELVHQLKATLRPRGRHAVDRGLAVFNSPQIATVVPDRNLRAALASLAGSPGQASIQTIRNGVYHRAVFGVTPNPDAGAQVVPGPNGPEIIFNQRYRYEDFRLLGVLFSHETLHQDPQLNANEELVSSTLQAGYHGQLFLEQPRLATIRTELARVGNTALMALLNTRDAQGRQRLVHSTGNVLPGNAIRPLPSFGAAFLGITPDGGTGVDPTSTPGNANLDFFLSAITHTRQTGVAFDTATVRFLDRHQAWATPEERIRLARLLKLRIPDHGKPSIHTHRSPMQGQLSG
jgi:hypothetical protein